VLTRSGCRAAVFLLFVAGAGCAGAGVAGPSGPVPGAGRVAALAARIDSIIDAPPLHRTSWGVLIVDAQTGRRMYARNAERHFIPASNMKLIVGAAALGRLGPDHRYRTELRSSEPMAAPSASPAVAPADVSMLLVVGSGDPTWSTRFHDAVTVPFDSMAALVAAAGIGRAGELVIDVSRFRDERVNPTWEVADLPGIFAPPVDAFAAADGTFRLVLSGGGEAGSAGSAAPLQPFHQPLRASVITDVEGTRTAVTTDYTARRDTIYLSARIAAAATDTVTLAVTRPAESAAAMLADALLRRGIEVDAIRVVRDSAEAAQLRDATTAVAAFESHGMDRIVATILRPSQNWIAEQVVKTLGAEFAGDGSWRGGNGVLRAWLAGDVGVDTLAVNLRDASGMSAQNLLTPEAAVAILDHARAQPWAEAFRTGLPQPGVAGTTLSARLAGLEGRVFAKTGTIANVNSLSGYFVATDGREYTFSILSNGSGLPAAMMRAAIDEVVRAMAAHLDTGP
jgi:serine-type D-Ala-D-Ala carboxypeptidase/endopeptidase (penicillin-binding protein 4)